MPYNSSGLTEFKHKIVSSSNIAVIKSNLFKLAEEYQFATILNSNGNGEKYSFIAAFSNSDKTYAYNEIEWNDGWKFGFLSYELKNYIAELSSSTTPELTEKMSMFFEPELLVMLNEQQLEIKLFNATKTEKEWRNFYEKLTTEIITPQNKHSLTTPIKARVSKEAYIETVNKIKQRIARGDIYEMNYCVDFYANSVVINPVEVYKKLNKISEAPFSTLSKFNETWVMGSSPERFLKKENNKLISQPIKGTAKRSENTEQDEQLKTALSNSLKEKTENVMIVDVARNDLSRIAERGTVRVDELFGVYTFKQVHQLISTISCELKNNKKFKDIIDATFPMASMTGAPKTNAMKLIDQYESAKRGLYSGSIGYIDADGDFDFNVVIRSIIYNAKSGSLSFSVGSAITHLCTPEQEYEECLLKARAMFASLEQIES